MDAPPLADVVFARVVEETAAAWSGSLRFLPEPEAQLVRALGCRHYDCREVAERAVRSLGPDARRLLVWGSRHRDPEVADRCLRLLEALTPCPSCGGRGVYLYGDEASRCNACGGTGSALTETVWEPEAGYVPGPRRLFTPSH